MHVLEPRVSHNVSNIDASVAFYERADASHVLRTHRPVPQVAGIDLLLAGVA